MSNVDLTKKLQLAAVALESAQKYYEQMQQEEAMARNRATDATNKLNQAQREFDKVSDEIRSNAPNGSEWNRSKEKKFAVTA